MSQAYLNTVQWLFSLQQFGIKLGLSSVQRLLELLGNPHHDLQYIHIAGTNGKGSTAAFLHSIYSRAGYAPGLYTSPHLVDFTERIVINGKTIKKNDVVALAKHLRSVCRRNNLEHITFFEFVTALALTYFSRQKADPVILETGMGGRLDATNVVQPRVSIITSINREHTRHLGPALSDIAREKGGIIKHGRPCISAVTQQRPRDCIRHICAQAGAQLLEYGSDFTMRQQSNGYCYHGVTRTYPDLHPGLAGRHQARNAALAVTACELLRLDGYQLEDAAIFDGISSCRWPGRLETIQSQPRTIILDGAHNPAAWQALMRTLKKQYASRRIVLIMGIMRDKDMRSLNRLTARAHTSFFFRPDMERSAGREYLEKYIVFSNKKRVFWCETIAGAIEAAYAKSSTQDIICVTGSLFAVGEARELLKGRNMKTSGRIGL